ncbi:hypothetical protein [Haladaptatus salinisoli]|uniref:hypothetical protein n=1 Tax=Haladaptatus salinisoli TaxID=2884876 RepID=UPI001D09F80F|nr:hypothetical protein [Haladaptatus salinisoli]
MPKDNETNRREVLKLAGASLASLSGINVVSAKQKTDAPSVNPNDQSTITEFIRYMVTLSYEEQKQAVNSLRDSERDAVLEALSDIRLETETTITRVEEQNDISAQAGRLEFAKNMVYGITKNGGQRAWAFKHTVSYRVNNGSIVRGSQTAN